MIDILFNFGPEVILVKIESASVYLGSTKYGAQVSTIEGLQLSKVGVIKEHPDLKDNPRWKEEAIKRFKEHVKNLPDEKARANYIIEDLKKFGYIPKKMQVKGFRPIDLEV